VFISWTRYTTRSVSFAEAVGAEWVFFHQGQAWGPVKYLVRGWLTVLYLLRRRPRVVYAMNPPFFLPILAWLYCAMFGAKLVLDSHTAAFDSPKWTWLMGLHRFAARRAVVSTVTNAELARRVEAMGARALVVTDIPYTMPEGHYPLEPGQFHVVFVCTYASDEPVLEVMDAARGIEGLHIHVTGNSKKATPEMHARRPPNVTFTGFLSTEQYCGLLRGADAVLVLTTRDHTMQRGGSEAVTVGKPLITSNWQMLRDTFPLGTIHVDNSTGEIEAALRRVMAEAPALREGIAQLATQRQTRWNTAHTQLRQMLGE
jgi:glycosyltransferase involved in cell wall biosynthesis